MNETYNRFESQYALYDFVPYFYHTHHFPSGYLICPYLYYSSTIPFCIINSFKWK